MKILILVLIFGIVSVLKVFLTDVLRSWDYKCLEGCISIWQVSYGSPMLFPSSSSNASVISNEKRVHSSNNLSVDVNIKT